jgi:ABC-type multidrug transport system fused ATPase/permease subunit
MKVKSKIGKAITDIAMVAALLGCAVSTSVFEEAKHALRNGAAIEDVFKWGTSHCIISILLVAIILIHIWQHWPLIKAIVKKNLYFKNKVITMTMALFLTTVVSFTLYLSGFTMPILHFHSMIAHFFVFFAIIHLIMSWKKLLALFRKNECREQTS